MSMNYEFLSDVIQGLSKASKSLPCKYFYDEQGSRLFEQICQLQDYYITRTELDLLEIIKDQISDLIGDHANIIEPGAGAGEKIQVLLQALNKPQSFTPLDISKEILFDSANLLRERFPEIHINPVVGDFTKFSELDLNVTGKGKTVLYFPGSTIGNFSPSQAGELLQQFPRKLCEQGALLIGVDLIKDVTTLEQAYDDYQGVTAKFNKNILARINNELGGNFDLNAFKHHALYNEELERIEMHLINTTEQRVSIGDQQFHFRPDESIHTENSYKYRVEDFIKLAEQSGWRSVKCWTDDQDLFSIHYLEVHNGS